MKTGYKPQKNTHTLSSSSVKNINNRFFIFEVLFYSVGFFVFIVLNHFKLPVIVQNIIYISTILLLFGYLFIIEFFFEKYDNAVHWKMFKKKYIPKEVSEKVKHKRQGLFWVCLCWFIFLSFLFILSRTEFMTWQLFLAGACFVFIFNSIFARKKCLLSVLFLKNKNHCCKSCGINSWDYLIFASALFFAPHLSLWTSITNAIIILFSLVMFIIWEYNYHKHPYRFYPDTNKSLSCAHCQKKCKVYNT